ASKQGSAQIVHMLLLLAKANPNVRDQNQQTPLMLASFGGHFEIVTALLKAGADPNAADQLSKTSLMYASMNGHDEIVQALIQAKAAVSAKDQSGFTALKYSESHPSTMKILQQAGAVQ